jgi:hypothetical protein
MRLARLVFPSLLLLGGLALPACSTSPDGTGATVGPIQTADGASLDGAVGEDVAVTPSGPPRAKVFVHDPVTDNQKVNEVTLVPPTTADGKLTGPSVEVHNCLQQDGGTVLKRSGFEIGTMCIEAQTVVKDPDGNYFSVAPPADFGDGQDPFAELQMYFHVSTIHDFFHDGFGLTDLDFPLTAIVNLTMNIKPEIAKFTGQEPGWNGFPNALFMPPEGFAQFGLPVRDNGAIVFGQYKATDFSYDASVIYHEYTHAMVGTTRLSGVTIDSTGLDNLPGAMNEGFADYFSCSLRDDPHIGAYALTSFGGGYLERDLSKAKKCPDDLTTEMHADGKIIGSALWQIRQKVGNTRADGIILKALSSFTKSTSLTGAGKLILAEAKGVDKTTGDQVKAILDAHGILTCKRTKVFEAFNADDSAEHVPYTVEGLGSAQGNAFPTGMPGYLQFYIDVPADTGSVAIGWHNDNHGGFGGLGKLGLAVRLGEPVQITIDGNLNSDAQFAVAVDAKDQSWQHVTLAGKCMPSQGGRVYLMFLNPGQASVAMDQMTVTLQKSTPTQGVPSACQ